MKHISIKKGKFFDTVKSSVSEIHEPMDANKGLFLQVAYSNDKKEEIPCGRILNSSQIVKIIPKGGHLWCDIKESKEIKLSGIILKNIKSFSFKINEAENQKWSVLNPKFLKGCWLESSEGSQQAEFMWIENDGIDSTTYRIILRAERVGRDIIVYSFLIP